MVPRIQGKLQDSHVGICERLETVPSLWGERNSDIILRLTQKHPAVLVKIFLKWFRFDFFAVFTLLSCDYFIPHMEMENINSNHKYKPQKKSNLFWKGLSTWTFWLHPTNRSLNRKLLNYGSWMYTHKGEQSHIYRKFLTEYVGWILAGICCSEDSRISVGLLKIMIQYAVNHFVMENYAKDRQKIRALWFVETHWRLWVSLGWVHFMVNTSPDGFKHAGRVSSTMETALSVAKWKGM